MGTTTTDTDVNSVCGFVTFPITNHSTFLHTFCGGLDYYECEYNYECPWPVPLS